MIIRLYRGDNTDHRKGAMNEEISKKFSPIPFKLGLDLINYKNKKIPLRNPGKVWIDRTNESNL